jgi:hypothetical protein
MLIFLCNLGVPSIWSLFRTIATPKWETRYVLGCSLQPCTSYARWPLPFLEFAPRQTSHRQILLSVPWTHGKVQQQWLLKNERMAAATKPVQILSSPSDPDL